MVTEQIPEEVFWIWLTQIPGIGCRKAHQLIDLAGTPRRLYSLLECSSPEAFWDQLYSSDIPLLQDFPPDRTHLNNHALPVSDPLRKTVPGITARMEEKWFYNLKEFQSIDMAFRVFDHCLSQNIHISIMTQEEYPDRLRSSPDMPILLYYSGRISINNYNRTRGIIGARRCTREGRNIVIYEVQKACAGQVAVISGMAKGIDGYAQTAAVCMCGYTVAVLGCGPDICYPKEHRRLMEEIVETGVVISEYPPGTRARQYHFPRRNRIIAGLSDDLVVIEAGRNSGTNSTIEYFLKLGKTQIVRLPPSADNS